MNFTDLVVDPGVIQDALGGCGLAGVDVRHDADVADLGEVETVRCHYDSVLSQDLVGDYQR